MRIDFVERIEGLRLEKTSPYPLQSTGEGTPLAVPRWAEWRRLIREWGL
jgi:hypothetical protein